MTAYEKPSLTMNEIEEVLRKQFGPGVADIAPMAGGNLSSVYSFVHEGKGYCVKFSDLAGAYVTERYVSDLLAGHGIPYPRCYALETTGRWTYLITERVAGRNLGDCTEEEQNRQLPELLGIWTKLAGVEVGSTTGYGWIKPDGNGACESWKDFVVAVNAEDQTGTFWENWHDLYRTSCLERDVVEEIYERLMAFVSYNEPHRGFIHGDFHQWNVLSDGERITGLIDGNCMYGDGLLDLVNLDRHMPKSGVVQRYQDELAKAGIELPYFKERLLGVYYYQGLVGLRFYAKMGWKDAYLGTRQFLLNLT